MKKLTVEVKGSKALLALGLSARHPKADSSCKKRTMAQGSPLRSGWQIFARSCLRRDLSVCNTRKCKGHGVEPCPLHLVQMTVELAVFDFEGLD
jgi:hypothetical protein